MNTKRAIIFLTVLTLLYAGPGFCGTKGAGPVAQWRFDEGGGTTAYDESANNNDVTLYNHTKFVPGKIGKALQFDGTDDYVDTNVDLSWSITDSFSMTAWVKNTGGSGNLNSIISKDNWEYTFYTEGNIIGFNYWNSAGNDVITMTGTVANITQWHFAAVTYDGSVGRLYIDGVLAATDASNSGILQNRTETTKIGKGYAWGRTNGYFNGLIDDVRIYNYCRSQDQVLVDYNAGSAAHLGAGTDPNEGNPPIGYWNFDENTGTAAIDRSGNGNNGTITGATWAQGKYGTALSFNGSSNYVDCGTDTSLNISGAISYEAWVKINSYNTDTNTGPIIMGSYGGAGVGYIFSLQGATGGAAKLHWRQHGGTGNNVIASESLSIGRWHHVAGSYDGTTSRVYVDGIEKASQAWTTPGNRAVMVIGKAAWASAFYFDGLIDEVKLYNYARTPVQITYDYNKGKPIAQYKFDEGTGTIAHNEYSTADAGSGCVGWWRMDNNWNDASGNGNNGTAQGNAGFSSSAKIGPYCGTFDGTGDGVTISNVPLNAPSAYTISAWVYPVSADGGVERYLSGAIGASFHNPDLAIGADGSLSFYHGTLGTGWQDTGYNLPLNQFSHVVFVFWNNGVVKTYIDGVERYSNTFTAGTFANQYNYVIGNRYDYNNEAMVGRVDDLRIYSYARTAEQIYNDYKTTHGTLVGTNIKFVDGKIGKALQFNGTDDYVNCGNDPNLNITGPISIEAWIMPNALGRKFVVAKDFTDVRGYGFGIESTGAVYIEKSGSMLLNTGTAMSTGSWSHIAVTFDGTNWKTWLNGTQVASTTGTGIPSQTTTSLTIGRRNYTGAEQYFNGSIDDVRIYNYSRAQDQVLQDYNAGASARLGAQATGTADPWGGAMPVGWWKLDENTGVLIQDASGNNSNATISSGATWKQGKYGSGLSFDGTNAVVTTNKTLSNFMSASTGTVSLWMKPTGSSTSNSNVYGLPPAISDACCPGGYFGIFRGNYTGVGDGIYIFGYSGSSQYVRIANYNIDEWVHITWVHTGGYLYAYKNGVLVGSTPCGDIGTGYNLLFGDSGSNSAFNGIIDDIKIYNYTRTPAQIAWDYNKGKPAAHWKFEEGSGTTAYDNSGNGNTGTITIGATGTQANVAAAWTNGATGKYGKCMSFDGTDDYVSAGDKLDMGTDSFTIETWIKTNTANNKAIIAKTNGGAYGVGYGYLLRIDAGKFIFNSASGAANAFDMTTVSTYNNNAWHHVAAVVDRTGNSSCKLYIDGKDDTASRGGDVAALGDISNALSFTIGDESDGGFSFPGLIDDVRIYNYARTADQVMQDYNSGAAARLGD